MYLILDLDNTIFDTSAIDKKVFEPAIRTIIPQIEEAYPAEIALQKVEMIRKKPFGLVTRQYELAPQIRESYLAAIESINFNLNHIDPFPDYSAIREFPATRYLLTTGFTNLQKAKITSLGIYDDFDAIYIDDPMQPDRMHKIDFLQKIQSDHKAKSSDFWVVGDKPGHEISAGNELQMNTVQRTSRKQPVTKDADFVIDTFHELVEILVKHL